MRRTASRLGVPRGGLDFIYGEAFPHETDMDQLGGVDFAKGCYVGQEVVSRVEHRGTARSRVIPVAFDGFGPEAGRRHHGGRQAGRARWDPRPAGAGWRCCASTASPMRWPPARRWSAAASPLAPVKPDWARFAFSGQHGRRMSAPLASCR